MRAVSDQSSAAIYFPRAVRCQRHRAVRQRRQPVPRHAAPADDAGRRDCGIQGGTLYAEPNYSLRAFAMPNDSRSSELWGLHNTGQSGGTTDADIDAPEAWDITTGSSSVVVAVVDTGIDYNHPDLAANMIQNETNCADGIDNDGNGHVDDCYGLDTINNDTNPMDDNRHGTSDHVQRGLFKL